MPYEVNKSEFSAIEPTKGEDIPLEYLAKCHEYHEKWLNGEKDILFIDATIDKKEEEYKKNIKQITKFISNFVVDDSNYYNTLTLDDIMAHPFM